MKIRHLLFVIAAVCLVAATADAADKSRVRTRKKLKTKIAEKIQDQERLQKRDG